VQSYATAAPDRNILEPLVVKPTRRPLGKRLAQSKRQCKSEGRHPGRARRASYEHQFDDHQALLDATRAQGQLVTMGRDARQRKSEAARRRARVSCAIVGAHTFHPWELLHAPIHGRAPALHDLRRKALRMLWWLVENHPDRTGWAERQSRPRTRHVEGATLYNIARAQWVQFYAWRRVARAFVGLLLLLHDWWEVLIPGRRSVSPEPTAKVRRSEPESESDPRTRYRDQSPRQLGALIRGPWPHAAM
jgi:hypothetical protein